MNDLSKRLFYGILSMRKTQVYQNALIQYYPLLYSYCEHDIDVAQTCIVFIYSAINKKMHFQLVDTEHTFTMTT